MTVNNDHIGGYNADQIVDLRTAYQIKALRHSNLKLKDALRELVAAIDDPEMQELASALGRARKLLEDMTI